MEPNKARMRSSCAGCGKGLATELTAQSLVGLRSGTSIKVQEAVSAALTSCDLNTSCQEVLGVTRGPGVPLAERLDVIHLQDGETNVRDQVLLMHAVEAQE